jgi:hypothetical protein
MKQISRKFQKLRKQRRRRTRALRRKYRGGVSDTPTSATIQGIAYEPAKTVVVTPFFSGSVDDFTKRLELNDM